MCDKLILNLNKENFSKGFDKKDAFHVMIYTILYYDNHAAVSFIKKLIMTFFFCLFMCGHLQVTAVSFNDTSDQVLSGGIDNEIKVSDS